MRARLSERENRLSSLDHACVLIVFSCVWSLTFPGVPPLVSSDAHPLGSCVQGYWRGLRGARVRDALFRSHLRYCTSGAALTDTDRNLGLRVFAFFNLYHPQRPRTLAERGI